MNSTQQRLLDLFAGLGAQHQASLLAFAEFLTTRESVPVATAPGKAPVAVPEPEKIERPGDESIVAGLKRLAKTYPMLDKSEMLGATSDLVATHVMQRTDPAQVIDRLEEIFSEHYRQLKSRAGT